MYMYAALIEGDVNNINLYINALWHKNIVSPLKILSVHQQLVSITFSFMLLEIAMHPSPPSCYVNYQIPLPRVTM